MALSGKKIVANKSLVGESALDLTDYERYKLWRLEKLKNLPISENDLLVKIQNFESPSLDEKNAIINNCNIYNMSLYITSPEAKKDFPLELARAVGLRQFDQPLCSDGDGLVDITVVGNGRRGGYVPYSNKPLSWHTDGYYNRSNEQVRGFLLHCSQDAEEGGVSEFFDPEIIYIRLRDENPDFIRALMQKDVLSIPANYENGVKVREAVTGPVFSVISGKLHMRYTDRKRHINWKADALVTAARQKLSNALNAENGDIVRLQLRPGQGVICNNVLHRRSGFRDSTDTNQKRLLFRARYLNRVLSK